MKFLKASSTVDFWTGLIILLSPLVARTKIAQQNKRAYLTTKNVTKVNHVSQAIIINLSRFFL